jgi:hypothetical protein
MSDAAPPPADAAADQRSLFARLADALDERLERALARFQRRGDSERPADQEAAPEAPAGAGARLKLPLMIGGTALLALAVGGGSAYFGLSKKMQRQAAELKRQSEELAAKTRALSDAEKRYLEQQLQLAKTEKRLSKTQEQLDRQPAPKPEAAAGTDKPLMPLPQITVSQPPRHGAAAVAPGGKCAVRRDDIGDTLRACIQAFNDAR